MGKQETNERGEPLHRPRHHHDAGVETDVSQTIHINPHLVLQPEGPPDTHPHIVAGVDGSVLLAIHAVSGVYGPLGRAEGPPACQC